MYNDLSKNAGNWLALKIKCRNGSIMKYASFNQNLLSDPILYDRWKNQSANKAVAGTPRGSLSALELLP